ncbi:MAG: tetratricopeptide repeat protein, partial [Bacteroidia bacterium]|nr:tetratricopeptide repeat protein [Bacteroidia bacterium]
MKRILLILMIGTTLPTFGQLSPYYSFGTQYYEAEDMFDKGLYGPALQRLDLFLQQEEGLRDAAFNDIHTYALFMQAVCAYQLERDDAEALLESFIFSYPENSRASQAYYFLGKYYLDRRNYRDAIDPLEQAYRSGSLPQDQFDEVVFFLGYAYFQEEKSAQATRYFDLASRRPNAYQEDAAYYKAILLYKDRDYLSAYDAFQDLRDSRKYSKETKIYLANTMLKLKKYNELYVLADELIQSRPTAAESEVFYIVANASFERQDYPRTTEYFERYNAARGRLSPSDNFRFGYSYYKQKRYKDAIPVLEKALGSRDSLAQVASYYLGFSFLQENDEASAKFAFQKASESKDNLTITQDALYQYGKLAFATKNYTEALTAFQNLKRDFPRAPFIDEVDGLIGEVFLYTKDYPRSIKYLESVPRTSARAKKAYQTVCYYYALSLYERGGFPQSEPFFQKAIDNPSDPDMALGAKYWLAEAKFRQGDFAAAKTAFQGYLSSRGASANEYFAKASYGLGWVNFKDKKYTEAIKNFESYIGQAGRNADKDLYLDAHLRIADAYFLQRDYAKANRYYQQVIDFKFTNMDYASYQLAEGFYRTNSYSQSVQAFDRMINSYR